jgi:hypothetical protein
MQTVALHILVEMIEMEQKQSRLRSIDVAAKGDHIHGRKLKKRVSENLMDAVSNLTVVEVEFIDKLDRFIMNEGQGDEEYQQWLVSSFQSKLQNCESTAFLQSLDRFLSLAFAIRSFGYGQLDSKLCKGDTETDDLALLLSQLLHFTALLDRFQIYVKYIHQLVEMQLKFNDIAEAGWALKLHADALAWCQRSEAAPVFASISLEQLTLFLVPGSDKDKRRDREDKVYMHGLLRSSDVQGLRETQTMFRRKELLYLIIIQIFTECSHYEHAIECAEVLAHEYAHTIFDYEKISKIHLVISDLTMQLMSVERFFSAYYRVVFIGNGWCSVDSCTSLLRGKQFVYRGMQWEKLGEFTERLLAMYPRAKVMTSSQWPPEQSAVESDEQWLLITPVKAEPNKTRFAEIFDVSKKDVVPDFVRQWYENNDTNTFTMARPIRKGPKSSDNEFLSLWTEEWTLKSEYYFPHFLRRAEVIECHRREIAPIENAVRTVESKNAELESLERRYAPLASKQKDNAMNGQMKHRRSNATSSAISNANNGNGSTGLNCNPLTMSINGAVDAPVNGGIPMYKKAFLGDNYMKQNPDHYDMVHRLRKAIDDQVNFHPSAPLFIVQF